MFQTNKVPILLIVQKYPALQTLTDCLSQPAETDISETLLHVLQTGKDAIKTVFFDTAKNEQISLLTSAVGDVPQDTIKELYNTLPNGANTDETLFVQQVRSVVQKHWANSLAAQIKNLWQSKTVTESPKQWSETNQIPAKILFENTEIVSDIQRVIDTPSLFVTEKLQAILESLSQWNMPELTKIQKQYGAAVKKIDALSGEKAKELLLKVVEKYPDVVELLEDNYAT